MHKGMYPMNLQPISLMSVQSVSFAITAFDFDGGIDHEDIDTISQTFDFQGNHQQQNIIKLGINAIGVFNLTYSLQNMDDKSIDKCVMETPTDVYTDQQVIITLSPGITSSIPVDTPGDTRSIPVDSTITQEVPESYS